MTDICPRCGIAYQEWSDENANRADRLCPECWSADARKYQDRVPPPEKRIPNTCRTCGAEIVWMKTIAGKNMPVDAISTEPGDELFDSKRHTSHFVTCTTSEKFRRKP